MLDAKTSSIFTIISLCYKLGALHYQGDEERYPTVSFYRYKNFCCFHNLDLLA